MPPEEEQVRICKEFLETDFVVEQLEKVRAHKEKLFNKLKSAEEYEKLLVEKLEERKRAGN